MEGGNILNITFDRMTVMGDLSDNRVSLLNQLIKKYSIARENKIHVSDTRYHSYIRGKFLDDLVYFEYDRLKAKSVARNLSPVPSCISSVVTSISPYPT